MGWVVGMMMVPVRYLLAVKIPHPVVVKIPHPVVAEMRIVVEMTRIVAV